MHAQIGTKIVVTSLSTVNKSSKENGDTINYKVLGRVLAACLCVFMLLQDGFRVGTTQKDNNHPLGLSAAIVSGIVCGVAVKMVDLTQEHGLRISTTKESMCYL